MNVWDLKSAFIGFAELASGVQEGTSVVESFDISLSTAASLWLEVSTVFIRVHQSLWKNEVEMCITALAGHWFYKGLTWDPAIFTRIKDVNSKI